MPDLVIAEPIDLPVDLTTPKIIRERLGSCFGGTWCLGVPSDPEGIGAARGFTEQVRGQSVTLRSAIQTPDEIVWGS